ncbi:MAG: hypothetical protein GY723_12625 [bacterium]|nr:hypothetical protein [bacterium]
MPLKLIDRIGALLRADAHGVVDALEERGLLLRQALREAELELLQKRARVAALTEEEARLRDEHERKQTTVTALDEDVALALTGEKEELARFAVRQLLPERRELESLGTQIEEVANTRTKLERRLEEQQEAFQTLRSRARTQLTLASRPADPCDPTAPPFVADEEVELELLRRRGTSTGGAV